MIIKKVLLIHPRHERIAVKKRRDISFPWGLAYVAGALAQSGRMVEILDAQARQLSKAEVMEEIKKKSFDLVGLSAFSNQFNSARIFSEFIKENFSAPVVVGGPGATHSAELFLKNSRADICVIGEGEETIVDLLDNLDNLEKVPGIAFKKGEEVVVNPARPYLSDLDNLPAPAYHLFNMPDYLSANLFPDTYAGRKSERYKGLKTINFITSRGCPYSCKFCSRNFSGYRQMSVDKIMAELEYLKNQFGAEAIGFSDELFLSKAERVREFSRRVIGLGLYWTAQARVNLVDYQLLKIMKEGNCLGVGFGIESGSQRLLDNMNKMTTVAQIKKAMMACRDLDLGVKAQLIFGYPGENEESVRETIDLLKELDILLTRPFSAITPIPGSPLWDEAVAAGKIKDPVQFLIDIEESFGYGQVRINFTDWSDEEYRARMQAATSEICMNYYEKNLSRYLRYLYNQYVPEIKKKLRKAPFLLTMKRAFSH